jgi:hypothetical protein
MRKVLRLCLVLFIAGTGLVTVSSPASAAPVNVIDCQTQALAGVGPAVNNPFGPNGNPALAPLGQPNGLIVPGAVPAVGGTQVLGPQDPCAELYRTLVFVGTASISNGVNFGGTGAGTAGGTFGFDGICVMVSYEDPTDSSIPTGDPTVSDCQFGTTDGEYHNPSQQTPIIKQAFADGPNGGEPAPNGNPVGNLLHWDPLSQASCFDSSGSGTSVFTSTSPLGAVETWTSSGYMWENGLSNLRGTIDDGPGGAPGPFAFDAKIEGHADPRGTTVAEPLDGTDAGCLQKNLKYLGGTWETTAGPLGVLFPGPNARVGLNEILIVGTASWDTRVPQVL